MNVSFSDDVMTYIRAGYPILNIISCEEDRVLDRMDELLQDTKRWKQTKPLFIWSITRGFVTVKNQRIGQEQENSPEKALQFLAKHKDPAIFLFKDFSPFLKDDYKNSTFIIRAIRDLVPELKSSQKCMVWVSASPYLPPELEKEVTVLDLPLPEEQEHRNCLESIIDDYKDNSKVMIDIDDEGKNTLVKACQGLTRSEAENAFAKTIVSRGKLTGDDVTAILYEKEQIIRKSGILEYTPFVGKFDSVGGLGNLKRWLRLRNQGFTDKARKFGLPYPRGVMLLGVPGCGKSLCAKAVAAEWQMPLLKFDLGRVFQSKVGESEENMRKALAVAESVAPCVLWIDELEKGLAGMGGDGGDGGVSTRVFGNLLTWMEEKKRPVFVVATGNNIEKLPPELLRKGRMDEIFFVDLPTPEERAEIIAIHIAKMNRDPREFAPLAALVEKTDGFNGAELEEMVKAALYEAFYDKKETKLKTGHLLKAAGEIVPLSRSRAKDIEKLRNWAAENCRPATEVQVRAAAADAPESAEEMVAERRKRMLEI